MRFLEEGRFGRISTPRRCRAPRGVRPRVREDRYAYVAVTPHNGMMDPHILIEESEQAVSLFVLRRCVAATRMNSSSWGSTEPVGIGQGI